MVKSDCYLKHICIHYANTKCDDKCGLYEPETQLKDNRTVYVCQKCDFTWKTDSNKSVKCVCGEDMKETVNAVS